MRILITGAGGQLGRELVRTPWPDKSELSAPHRQHLDIADSGAVNEFVADFEPNVIINTAAYTAVDAAEADPDQAALINGDAVRYLAEAANSVDAFLVHISTDYVFDGTKASPYRETDPTNPVSTYGRTKLAGEQAMDVAEQGVTLRTSWVYGALGKNFAATVLRLIAERDEISIVGDQVGCPTATPDLARAITELVAWTQEGRRTPPSRLYHLAGGGEATWHDLAVAVIEAADRDFDGPCHRITTDQYPTPARRPSNSRLACDLIRTELGIAMPHWRQTLPDVVAELEEPQWALT